jgi:hypothetical protein
MALLWVKNKPKYLSKLLPHVKWRLDSRVVNRVKIEYQVFYTGDDVTGIKEKVELDYLPVIYRA